MVYRPTPTLDEIARDLPQHGNFYIRGIFNSLLPQFLNPFSDKITETEVSGEMLEALRAVANHYGNDLKNGEVMQIDYKMVQDFFKEKTIFEDFAIESIGDQIRTSLGAFALSKVDGQFIINDAYDFEDYVGQNIRETEKRVPVFRDYRQAAVEAGESEGVYGAARVMGGYFMPENPDRTSSADALMVDIKIPKEPQVTESEYDVEPPEGAQNFVFRGPMTKKRWNIFSGLISPAGASELNPAASMQMLGSSPISSMSDKVLQPSQPLSTDTDDAKKSLSSMQYLGQSK